MAMYVQKRFLENILGAIVSMVARHALTIPDLECHDKRKFVSKTKKAAAIFTFQYRKGDLA